MCVYAYFEIFLDEHIVKVYLGTFKYLPVSHTNIHTHKDKQTYTKRYFSLNFLLCVCVREREFS